MQLLIKIYLAILAIAASHALAVPAAIALHERDVPSAPRDGSPEPSPYQDDEQSTSSSSLQYDKKLPGVNHKPVPTMLSANASAGAVSSNPIAAFGQKCTRLTLLGDGKRGQSTLQAACLDNGKEGSCWLTSLNLNQCLGNDGGQLVFRERGNYDATCRPCGVETTAAADGQVWLRCACLREADGVSTFAELSLSQHYGSGLGIKVLDGRLVCGSHQGTKSPQFGTSSGNDGGEK
ncbi:SH3 domain protein [Akanthomyces lecanii RCEF 1005]|uniref:SH3 domain protein n=1 Tax=Akanthomyces lecanii RCEF 1005 TaxID=1081108 RepID=A0A168K946_CORDF|nr:SH3 domain protein [Akanthomyces lecanii RCEF 1005]